jgi:hypothetical protein
MPAMPDAIPTRDASVVAKSFASTILTAKPAWFSVKIVDSAQGMRAKPPSLLPDV